VNVGDIIHVKPLSKIYVLQLKVCCYFCRFNATQLCWQACGRIWY